MDMRVQFPSINGSYLCFFMGIMDLWWDAWNFHLLKLITKLPDLNARPRIFVKVMIYRRFRIGRDGHLDQSKASIYRNLYENTRLEIRIL